MKQFYQYILIPHSGTNNILALVLALGLSSLLIVDTHFSFPHHSSTPTLTYSLTSSTLKRNRIIKRKKKKGGERSEESETRAIRICLFPQMKAFIGNPSFLYVFV